MDFAAIFQTWRNVLTQPGEPVFEQERTKPTATLTTALIWIVIAGVVTAVLGLVSSLIFLNSGMMNQIIGQMNLPPETAQQLHTMLAGGMGGAGVASIIFTPISLVIGFLIGAGILHLLANIFGGRGDFGNYAYLLATFQTPILIINAVLGFIPVLGGCLGALLSIYGIVLTYYATKVEYNLTSGRTIAVLLIPLLLVLLLIACFIFVLAGLFMSLQNR